MKILSIGTDRKIFEENSDVRQRIIEYGGLVNELHIIIFTIRNSHHSNGIRNISIAENVFVYSTNSLSKWLYIFDAYRIAKKILFASDQWLVTTQDPFECGLAGWWLKRKFGIPLQFQIHTDFLSPYFVKHQMFNRLRVWLAKFLIPRANCIRVVSERIKKSLLRVTRYSLRVTTLPIFVDIKKIQDAPIKTDLRKKYPQFDFIILMASRLTKEKNIGLAIDVFTEIAKKYPKAGLIIVGSGPKEQNLKSQISNLKINENVIIEGWTDDLPSYYKTADLFLMTSNYEGYGMTVVEAAASGCNIISSDVGVVDEILEGDNIFEPGNKKSLEEKIIKAIKNEIKPTRLLKTQTKEEYLSAYKKSWEQCGS